MPLAFLAPARGHGEILTARGVHVVVVVAAGAGGPGRIRSGSGLVRLGRGRVAARLSRATRAGRLLTGPRSTAY